ncbi:MAG: hypothetical protein IAE97_09395 [Chthoniobacterales bacterium]|nr:hypothetical protein [Chthoniobacterales bacterium]
MRWTLLIALVAGCRAKPEPTVADLHFPVVVIYGTTSVVLYPNAHTLGFASIASLNALTGPPALIDSDFNIYILEELASTHGTLWLMTHPTGNTPVTFQLARAPESGIAVARQLLRPRLEDQTWRDDLDQGREALAREETLAGMFAIVDGKDD